MLKAKDAAGTPLAQAETYPVMRVLVTGAGGQVGVELSRELLGPLRGGRRTIARRSTSPTRMRIARRVRERAARRDRQRRRLHRGRPRRIRARPRRAP